LIQEVINRNINTSWIRCDLG